jgi:hypothetical protein
VAQGHDGNPPAASWRADRADCAPDARIINAGLA